MLKIVLLKGLPASGKTTWALEKTKKENYLRVSKDDIRNRMFGGYSPRKEQLVVRVRNQLIRIGLSLGKNIIVDDTNLNPAHERYLRQLASELGAQFIVEDEFLEVSPEECIKRDLRRGEEAVGADVIWRQYYKWLCPQPIKKMDFEFSKPRAVICDLGGVFYPSDIEEWGKPEKRELNPFLGCIIDALASYGQELNGNPYPSVIIITDRSEADRKEVEEELARYGLPYDKLLMRDIEDDRSEAEVKEAIYHRDIEPYYAVLGVIGDRGKVSRKWRSLGFLTLQSGIPEIDFVHNEEGDN